MCGSSPALALSPVEEARALEPPKATAVTNAEFEHKEFWEANGNLLKSAWSEYSSHIVNGSILASPNDCVHPLLQKSVAAARASPTPQAEKKVRSLWTEVAPGVFSTDAFLNRNATASFRHALTQISSSGIPTRRPNGMNRFGVILDPEVSGAVPILDDFVTHLVDTYVRPLGRLFFPAYIGPEDDLEMFAFTIQYRKGQDVKLNEHRDASVVTLNLNLNLDDNISGSSLYFVDEEDKSIRHTVDFRPGMALIHKGSIRHAALPILDGERQNLVVWLFGKDGDVRVSSYPKKSQLGPRGRWNPGGEL